MALSPRGTVIDILDPGTGDVVVSDVRIVVSTRSAPPVGLATYAKLPTCEVDDCCRVTVLWTHYASVSRTVSTLLRPSSLPGVLVTRVPVAFLGSCFVATGVAETAALASTAAGGVSVSVQALEPFVPGTFL